MAQEEFDEPETPPAWSTGEGGLIRTGAPRTHGRNPDNGHNGAEGPREHGCQEAQAVAEVGKLVASVSSDQAKDVASEVAQQAKVLLGRLRPELTDAAAKFRVMGKGACCVAAVGMTVALIAPIAPAEAATFHVRVTCSVPTSQPKRQLAPNSCLNYVPDGTQTYTALVTDGNGRAVAGARVNWTDSSSTAAFRASTNPCTTARNGKCSSELAAAHPRKGQKIKVTAAFGGATGVGYLTFA